MQYGMGTRVESISCSDNFPRLVYALLGLVSQMLLAVYYGLSSSVELIDESAVAHIQPLFPYLTDFISLTGSVCLFITRFLLEVSAVKHGTF